MKITILIDGSRHATASFERGPHPADSGDLNVLRKILDKTYQDARAYLDRRIGNSTPLPTDTESGS